MAITLATNFGLTTGLPIDNRTVVADAAARNALPSGVRFDGLIVYQLDTNIEWQLQGNTTNWVDITSTAGGDINGGSWA